jgi:AraC-like DNA-binding protein
MGEKSPVAGDFAQAETPACSGVAGPARRTVAAGARDLLVQIHQHDGAHLPGAADQEGASAAARYFLLLIDTGETAGQTGKSMPGQAGATLDQTALAEQCPRWRQFAFRPIAADQGLAAVVRSHIAMLAEQSANIDPAAAASMAPVTIGLVAALLNSLDVRAAAEPANLPAYHRRRIKEFVLNNLCNPMLDVDMVAEAVGLSTRYIHQLFENEPASLMQWIITKRLVHCRGLLVDQKRRHWKISQIAYDSGFNDLAHFSRSFRKFFNVSPSQARAGAV